MNAPPEGFSLHDRSSPVTDPWAPIYARKAPDRYLLGLHVRAAHTNSRGLLHGGLIAALADNAMGLSCGVVLAAKGQAVAGLMTVSLSLDYLGRAELGQWLVFDTDLIRPSRTLCYAQAGVSADGALVARAHATFKLLADPKTGQAA